MLKSLYKYILSLRVDCTVCKLPRIYSILNCILKMNIGALKNKGLVLLFFQQNICAPLISPPNNAAALPIFQEP